MILGPDGKPINLSPDLPSAEEKFSEKKSVIDTYYDRVFIYHLIKRFQAIEPQVGAVFYPHTQCVAFWYYGIIVYKVMLTAHNVDEVSMAKHIDTFRLAVAMVKTNPELRHKLQEQAKHHNKKFGKNL